MTQTLDQVMDLYKNNIEGGEEVIITLYDAVVKLFEGSETPVVVVVEPTTDHVNTTLVAFLDQ
ncbi:hypothetical protein MUO14_03530 [Halobacillus shinanisalinarum]|uniref:Uncharacterized protein n=1 Tax=Halobacillus shinanisalinarum TaxID=2932258 RepID=A0ABY4H1J7_9BACI|nr:hypothetical protein [Halobacillus shinanisalinarum]UOQ94053.1 hypothetical protein MUO14_03530 [Halobacillus shinanisalinarum]